MALRKEEFEEDASRKRQRMTHEHIDLNVSGKLLRRITMAAQQQNMPIDEYLERILEEAVPSEGSPPQKRQPATKKMLEELMAFRDQMLRDHGGEPFEDSTELIREMREERSRELAEL